MSNKLYFDCSYGISGDMVLAALIKLVDETKSLTRFNYYQKAESYIGIMYNRLNLSQFNETKGCDYSNGHDHNHSHSHSHRSYSEIRAIINSSRISEKVKEIAQNIYETIAKAESKVHGEPLESLHFHEVGRNQAIRNIVGVAICVEALQVEKVYCNVICDGKGFVECSHGKISVPVPAVKAMMEQYESNFKSDGMKNRKLLFKTIDVDTELVTPSGLAMLIGMGAEYSCERIKEVAKVKVTGTRKICEDAGLTVVIGE